jgi:AcrR family transcriptional regulator
VTGPEKPRLTRAERRQQTEDRILASARRKFAEVGYERTTIRAVASAAGVDPALVMQYFGSKEGLFREAVRVPEGEALPAEPAEFAELVLSILGVKLGELPGTSLPLLRSAFTHPEAAEEIRASIGRQIEQARPAIRGDNPELRAALIFSVLLGVSIGRHAFEIDYLRDATPEQITDLLRPSMQKLIEGDEPSTK